MKGSCESQNMLGKCYELGEGVEKDLEMAKKYYQKSGEQGYQLAKDSLASLLEREFGEEVQQGQQEEGQQEGQEEEEEGQQQVGQEEEEQ